MKIIIMVTFLLMGSIVLSSAQTSITYTYDDSGNRTGHFYEVSVIPSAMQEQKEKQNKDELIEESFLEYKVYPNPVTEYLSIEIPDTETDELVELSLISIGGKQIHHEKTEVSTVTIPMAHLSNGIYILRSKRGSIIKEWKIIKR